MRALLDVNILTSAALTPKGEARKILHQARVDYELLVSDFMYHKLEGVLQRPHIQRKYTQLTPLVIAAFLAYLRGLSTLVVEHTAVTESRDPEDNHILAAAVDGRADYLVTYNISHFPATYQGIKVVLPSAFRRAIHNAETQDKPEREDTPSGHREESGGIGVGDRVQFRFGSAILTGRVVEDRGKIGMGGRRLLRVHFDIDGDQKTLELPEEELILM